MASPSLASLMQTLPVELFDNIYNLTVAAITPVPSHHILEISPTSQPPKILQISKDFRIDLAQAYYSTNIFLFTSKALCVQWLAHIPAEHAVMIRRLRIDVQPAKHAPPHYDDLDQLDMGTLNWQGILRAEEDHSLVRWELMKMLHQRREQAPTGVEIWDGQGLAYIMQINNYLYEDNEMIWIPVFAGDKGWKGVASSLL
jgi:hypothetical protein